MHLGAKSQIPGFQSQTKQKACAVCRPRLCNTKEVIKVKKNMVAAFCFFNKLKNLRPSVLQQKKQGYQQKNVSKVESKHQSICTVRKQREQFLCVSMHMCAWVYVCVCVFDCDNVHVWWF